MASTRDNDLAQVIRGALRQNGIEAARARAISAAVARRLCEKFGGGSYYFAKRSVRAIRDAEIRRRFNGRNRAELAREFGVSGERVRQIVRQV